MNKRRAAFELIILIIFVFVLTAADTYTADAATINVKITQAKIGASKNVRITAKQLSKPKSDDNKYYLVKINTYNNAPVKALAEAKKAATVTFKLSSMDKANVISKFGIAIKKNGAYVLVSNTKYVSNITAIAKYTQQYKKPLTKKGIHFANDVNIGSNCTLININVNDLIGSKENGNLYVYNGKKYYFTNVMQDNVRGFVSRGINVTGVIYMTWSEKNSYLIHPKGREPSSNGYYYMLNTRAEKARETLEAMFCYLAEKFSTPDCHISNWILGNEVNSPVQYNHAGARGAMSLANYSREYALAFEMFSDAIKTAWANPRVFYSIDNAWNIPVSIMGWNGITFVRAFDSALKNENSLTKWNLAYHCYSFDLTDPPFMTRPEVTNSIKSPYITPKNLKYLTDYIKSTYGRDTHIILSEQGWSASMGETVQAASLVYAYYAAEFNKDVEEFIMRAQIDDTLEIKYNYYFGLTDLNGKKREIYDAYKYMDTANASKYVDKYLKTIGISNWKKVNSAFDASRFKNVKR